MKAKKQKIQSVHSRSSSGASVTFVKNSYSIHRLFIIHGEITGDRRGRRYNIDVLNKAAIIFITAYWEAYIEDVCKEFTAFILANCTDYKKFPTKGRLAASKKLVKQKDGKVSYLIMLMNSWTSSIRPHLIMSMNYLKSSWMCPH